MVPSGIRNLSSVLQLFVVIQARGAALPAFRWEGIYHRKYGDMCIVHIGRLRLDPRQHQTQEPDRFCRGFHSYWRLANHAHRMKTGDYIPSTMLGGQSKYNVQRVQTHLASNIHEVA